ncbi:Ribosome assembly protein 4 [Colletotrichum higginsianum IMI 349063]|uniref:Ribosome assembly protein 4 n=3 Tax=Colletotrichum higginsianum TaxID=80884 RepID=A0A1B7Y5H1_COLHI|nr:Ribosome assembly protein 4 [Colletotrichum higginsianum IMI 349063]OBR07244.1 Ribosome assembly protein 4 [Colletotrichum higginsianum IMI 349063]TIC92694.1 putative serine/threonine-protein kinase PkwA [Colletotrichum higginsianum]
MDGSHTAGLGPECQRLQSGLPPAGAAVRAFISAHPETQVRLSPLAEELLCLPDVVAALLRSAAGCEGEDRFLLEARQVPGVCADIVRQVEGAFPEGGGSSRWSLRRDDAWRSAAERASALGTCLATGRRIMSLAVDALDLSKSLRRAEEAGESPPYATNVILQEITSIKETLSRQSSQDQAASLRKLAAFLEYLKSYIHSHSTTVPASDMARLTVTASNARTSMYSLPDDPSPSPSIEPYPAPALLPAASSPVTFRHIRKVVMQFEKEPVGIKFTSPSDPTSFAVSSFFNDISLFDADTGDRRRSIKVKGAYMVFSPVGDLVAVTTEHVEDGLHQLNPQPILTSHDMVHFRQAALHVIDWANDNSPNARRFMLHWHGIRPYAFSPDGRLLAIRGVRDRVEVVTSAKGQGYSVLRGHTDEVTHAEFTADAARLVTMSRDGTLRVSSVETGRNVAKIEMEHWRNPLMLGVSPTGVVASIWGRTVTIWDYETGAVSSYNLETAKGSEGIPLAVSSDLRWAAYRSDEGADVTDLASGKVVYSARLESGFAVSAAFSAGGRYLVVGRCLNGHHARSDSGILNMWEIQT